MKAFLLVLLLGCCFTTHAQAPATKPAAKSNVVIIQTTDSAGVALKNLAQAFVNQGYTVDKLDTQFLTLTLAPKTLPTTFDPILLAKASASTGSNSRLQLTGEYRAVVMGQPLNGAVGVKGSEKGVTLSGFRALEKVALTYPGGQVSYGRQ